jgi:hypothetical protein
MGRGHILDGDTFALYKADETNLNLLDSSTNALNLTATSATGSVVESLFRDPGNARFFDGGYAVEGSVGQSGAMGTWNAMLALEHTFETWLRLADTDAVDRRVFEYGVVGAAEAQNSFYLVIESDRKLTVSWEKDAGVSVSYTTTAVIPVNPNYVTTHLGYKKRSAGGGQYRIDFFVNNALLETSSLLDNYTGGADGIMTIGGTADRFFGRMDDIRFSRIARSDSEIIESYTRGIVEPLLIIEE